MKIQNRTLALVAAAGLAMSAGLAFGQAAPDASRELAMGFDSGAMNIAGQRGDETQVVWARVVSDVGAPWMRVHFGAETVLAGPDRHHGGSYLTITSVKDGAVHFLDAKTLPEWDRISAFMNGDALLVELHAAPGSGLNRVVIEKVTAGLPTGGPDTICGTTDNRVPDNDPRVGRVSTGCTGWLINENGLANEFLTAGHCLSLGQTGVVMMFNVPPATSGGTFVAPPVEFQFPIQSASIQRQDGAAVGDDWAHFLTNNNSNTGLPARSAQGRGSYSLAASAPAGGTATTTVRGHGIVNDQSGIPLVPEQWQRINKVHAAPYAGRVGNRINYLTDTDNANSGSPVTQLTGGILEQAIGIHTDGFCPGTFNSGTAIDHPNLQAALASPDGVQFPFSTAYYKQLNTLMTSDNGGLDGGSIFFDITTGANALEITHFFLNINRNGATNNGTTTEDDDFFNFEVFIREGTARGFEDQARSWTKVAEGAGMPRPEDIQTLGALKNTFVLNASQDYGIAIIFDDGAGHAYNNASGSNEVYSNADLTITGISASNTRFGATINDRVFNGAVGYIVNQTPGQCLETIFSSDNNGGNGGLVLFDVDVAGQPVTLTGLSTNVEGAGGLDCTVRLYRASNTYVGKETNAGAWTLVATGTAVSEPINSPTRFAFNNFVNLNANTGYGLAIELDTSGTTEGHAYTNGTGLNQVYADSRLEITSGAAMNAPFTGTVNSPRVWNGALCYGVDLATCTNSLFSQRQPSSIISPFNSTPGGQEEADRFINNQIWDITGGAFWGAYSSPSTPPATQDMVFRFFEDNSGIPGALIATRVVNNINPVDTGLASVPFSNKPIYQYEVTFPAVRLAPGRYWISALGDEAGFTWAWARTNTTANAHAVRTGTGAWTLSAGDFAFVLCGTQVAACYPDCDTSTGIGVLDIFDFLCFQNQYAANAAYACNCDTSTGINTCDIFDFLCFQNAFAAGCP